MSLSLSSISVDELSSLRVADLKVLLKEADLPQGGRKAELIERLKAHIETQNSTKIDESEEIPAESETSEKKAEDSRNAEEKTPVKNFVEEEEQKVEQAVEESGEKPKADKEKSVEKSPVEKKTEKNDSDDLTEILRSPSKKPITVEDSSTLDSLLPVSESLPHTLKTDSKFRKGFTGEDLLPTEKEREGEGEGEREREKEGEGERERLIPETVRLEVEVKKSLRPQSAKRPYDRISLVDASSDDVTNDRSIHITQLVRPFTNADLQQWIVAGLTRGTVTEAQVELTYFVINSRKTHAVVTFSDAEIAKKAVELLDKKQFPWGCGRRVNVISHAEASSDLRCLPESHKERERERERDGDSEMSSSISIPLKREENVKRAPVRRYYRANHYDASKLSANFSLTNAHPPIYYCPSKSLEDAKKAAGIGNEETVH